MTDARDLDTLDRLWQHAEETRTGGKRLDVESVLRQASADGVRLGWRDLTWLIERVSKESTPREFVVDFLRAYLRARHAKCLVDPAVVMPAMILALADGEIAESAVGFARFRRLAEAADAAAAVDRVRWQDGWLIPPAASDLGPMGSPDLIVSAPPVGLERVRQSYETADGEVIEVADSADAHLTLTARELAPAGEAIFVVPEGFLFRRGHGRARAVLPRLGLHVHACVNVLRGFKATGIPFNVLALRHEPTERVWVGQLSPQVNLEQLAENMRQRRQGQSAELGRLVEWETFEGFEKLLASERLRRLIKIAGFPTVPLGDLLLEEIKPHSRERDQAIEPKPNTVYLPTFLNATAHSDKHTEGLKASGYVPLILDPERASAEYLTTVFNSELGRALRAALSGGTTISSLRGSALRGADVPLPSLDVQNEAVATRTFIRGLRSTLDEIEHALTERPREARRLRRELEHLGQTDLLRPWMESLPFPLASIVWRYRADADVDKKVDHLLRLFEASAVFFASVLLSAFDADEELLAGERKSWGDEHGALHLSRATFGAWTMLGRAMAGSARRLLARGKDDPGRTQMRAAFAVKSQAFVELATSKELWKLLDALLAERNAEHHGGIKGPGERKQKLARLEASLAELRSLTQEGAQEIRLVRPGDGGFRQGVTEYRRALMLSGYTDAFSQTSLESLQQLEAEELYIVDDTDEPLAAALKVAPLVRLRASPSSEENACYFYSRLDGDQAEYVSHHFESEARIQESDPQLVAFIERLNAR